MKLAERGTFLGGEVWVREIRKLTATGHQTAILSTDYRSETARLAGAMFFRWSQENFFRYMRQHYSLDSLVDYRTEVIPETAPVVNPPTAPSMDRCARDSGSSTVSGRNSAH
jgi:hypothetical protein